MKFSTALFTATTFLTALAAPSSTVNYKLQIDADNSEVNGKYVLPYHEGAGINYSFLSGQAETFTYNPTTHVLYQSIKDSDSENIPYNFSVNEHHVLFSVIGTDEIDIIDGKLSFKGSADSFFACKNTGDPYNYSKDTYELLNYAGAVVPSECIAVIVKAIP